MKCSNKVRVNSEMSNGLKIRSVKKTFVAFVLLQSMHKNTVNCADQRRVTRAHLDGEKGEKRVQHFQMQNVTARADWNDNRRAIERIDEETHQ